MSRRAALLLACFVVSAIASPSARADGEPAPTLPGTPDEQAGIQAIINSQWVRAREVGETLLQKDADSIVGHFVLGMALHHGEGDLPRAYFHLDLAVNKFDARYPNSKDAPWPWHGAMLMELASVLGEMERCEEQLAMLERHDALYQPPYLASRIWPLMKLKRYDEARLVAQAAIKTGDPSQRKHARADLCGAESEAGDRQKAFEACSDATSDFRQSAMLGGQLEFANAGDAALEVFRHDEAERDLKEATARPAQVGWVNPYQQLVELYLTEGRVAEAIEAMRGAQQLRLQHPASLDQFVQSRVDGSLAELFLVAGIADRAVAAARRASEQPDRQGHNSGTAAQVEAWGSLLYSLALHDQAVRWEEDAGTSRFVEGIKLRAKAAWARLEAWRARRRVAVALADEELLARTLRPYYLGVTVHPWLLPDIVDIVGSGVALAGVERARRDDRFPGVEKYFAALEAAAAWTRGDCRSARDSAMSAAMGLPRAEVSLGARMHAIAASCSLGAGDLAEATTSLSVVLEKAPDLVRRVELRVPVAIEHDGSDLGERAARLVRRSPRFRDNDSSPFRVTITGGQQPRACLFGPSRAQLACGTINLPVDTAADDGARLLVAEFHKSAFARTADLSQSDLTSLDGSPTAARADQRVRSVLDKLGDEDPR